jgi:putative ABC transport system substrate-binding protein
MHRRQFLISATFITLGQQRAVSAGRPRIGLLGSESPAAWTPRLLAFFEGMKRYGFIENQTLDVEYRWAEGRTELLERLAAELVGLKVDVLVVLGSTPSAVAAKKATRTIPVVFRVGADPVKAGLVASLSRPGGNATGVTTLGASVAAKQVELLHEIAPNVRSYGLLLNPANPIIAADLMEEVNSVARTLRLNVSPVNASTEAEIESAFDAFAARSVGAVVIAVDTFFNAKSERLAQLAAAKRLPAVSAYEEFVNAGGLISYGGSINEASMKAGICVARVLKGEAPSSIPVEQSTALRLTLNKRAAASMDLVIPSGVLARADDVIE